MLTAALAASLLLVFGVTLGPVIGPNQIALAPWSSKQLHPINVLGNVALFALPALVVPSGAAAAPWKCEASVVRGAVGTSPPAEPITANKGAPECVTQSAGDRKSVV